MRRKSWLSKLWHNIFDFFIIQIFYLVIMLNVIISKLSYHFYFLCHNFSFSSHKHNLPCHFYFFIFFYVEEMSVRCESDSLVLTLSAKSCQLYPKWHFPWKMESSSPLGIMESLAIPGNPLSPHVPLVNAIRGWQLFAYSSSPDTVCMQPIKNMECSYFA